MDKFNDFTTNIGNLINSKPEEDLNLGRKPAYKISTKECKFFIHKTNDKKKNRQKTQSEMINVRPVSRAIVKITFGPRQSLL